MPGSIGNELSSTGWSAILSPALIPTLAVNGPLTASTPVALVTATGSLVATARQFVPAAPTGASTRNTNCLPVATPALRKLQDVIVPVCGELSM